ncbi:MarR family transcriptional regulator [Flavisphingomonas formosensis]|uniref:MarR family transcriptional regulator n=1 Tax=Flavisphingomonas formosensis TaxID=861534 RepID=UPI0012FCEDFC|nr:MarR family transcriptional regulator [Sphingomonas formosensis]
MLIAERKLLGERLGFDACPSPTWDILLDLYLAHHERRAIYLWSLCIAANIPLSSAHRKISELVPERASRALLRRSGRSPGPGDAVGGHARLARSVHGCLAQQDRARLSLRG